MPLDIKITPNDNVELGVGLFDHPAALFATETLLFFGGLWIYTSFAPLATKIGYRNNMNILKAVAISMVVQQAHFCFGSYVLAGFRTQLRADWTSAERLHTRQDGYTLPYFCSRS